MNHSVALTRIYMEVNLLKHAHIPNSQRRYLAWTQFEIGSDDQDLLGFCEWQWHRVAAFGRTNLQGSMKPALIAARSPSGMAWSSSFCSSSSMSSASTVGGASVRSLVISSSIECCDPRWNPTARAVAPRTKGMSTRQNIYQYPLHVDPIDRTHFASSSSWRT